MDSTSLSCPAHGWHCAQQLLALCPITQNALFTTRPVAPKPHYLKYKVNHSLESKTYTMISNKYPQIISTSIRCICITWENNAACGAYWTWREGTMQHSFLIINIIIIPLRHFVARVIRNYITLFENYATLKYLLLLNRNLHMLLHVSVIKSTCVANINWFYIYLMCLYINHHLAHVLCNVSSIPWFDRECCSLSTSTE